jgi:hypothetical protein
MRSVEAKAKGKTEKAKTAKARTYPTFAFCLLPFAFCLLPFALCLLPFAFCVCLLPLRLQSLAARQPRRALSLT